LCYPSSTGGAASTVAAPVLGPGRRGSLSPAASGPASGGAFRRPRRRAVAGLLGSLGTTSRRLSGRGRVMAPSSPSPGHRPAVPSAPTQTTEIGTEATALGIDGG